MGRKKQRRLKIRELTRRRSNQDSNCSSIPDESKIESLGELNRQKSNKERVFQCPHCSYAALVTNLKRHLELTHEMKNWYKCPICDHSMGYKYSLINPCLRLHDQTIRNFGSLLVTDGREIKELREKAKQKQHDRIPIMDKDLATLDAFRLIDEKPWSASIHASPRFHGKPFILDTDFRINPDAIGGVLLQEPGGPERVTTRGARRLQSLEPAYASIRGEFLAVMFFSQNPVLHRFLFVQTGNRALTWSLSRYSPTGRILRWLETLASFDFTIQLRKGALQGNADSLSRVPHAALPSPVEEEILVSDEAAVVAVPQAPPGFPIEGIKEHQERDGHPRAVQHGKTEPPSETEKQMLSPDQRRLFASMSPLHQGLPYGLCSLRGQEEGFPCDRLYVPHALRHWVIEVARQFLDHTGINSTSHFCRKGVFMFRLVPEVHQVLQHCRFCQVKSQKAPTPKDVHHPSIQAATPFQVWSMDVIGPVCASSEDHRYLRNWKDVFS